MNAKNTPVKDLSNMFRPDEWSAVKGQDSIVKMLQSQIKTQKGLSNAYLFAGPSGVGKTTLARLFFRCLNQDVDANFNPPPNNDWLVDLLEINGSNTRGIDDMREIIKLARYYPTGKIRGVLIDEAHMLTKPAWDCLLKPIEDSTAETVWMFCTTELPKVPKTIFTRCQVHKLNPLKWTDIKIRLEEIAKNMSVQVNEQDLWTIARASDNNLRQAIHTFEKYTVTGTLEGIISSDNSLEFLDAIASDNLKDIWTCFMQWQSKFDSMEQCLNSLKYELTNTLKVQLGIQIKIPPMYLKKYKEYADIIPQDTLLVMLEQLFEIQHKVVGVYDYNSLFLNALCQYRKNIHPK